MAGEGGRSERESAARIRLWHCTTLLTEMVFFDKSAGLFFLPFHFLPAPFRLSFSVFLYRFGFRLTSFCICYFFFLHSFGFIFVGFGFDFQFLLILTRRGTNVTTRPGAPQRYLFVVCVGAPCLPLVFPSVTTVPRVAINRTRWRDTSLASPFDDFCGTTAKRDFE